MPFREFHRKYHSTLRNYVTARRVPPDDVGDVVQDVFVIAFQRRDTLDDPDRMVPWLLVSARNVIQNYRRRESPRKTDPLDDEPTIIDRSPRDAEEEMLTPMRVLDAIEALDDQDREAWELRYLADLTLPEIAARCGCTLKTVRGRVARAEETVDGAMEERER